MFPVGKMAYPQYLRRVQNRGSQRAKSQLCTLLRRKHLWTEVSVIAFAVVGILAYAVGLGIGAVIMLVLAALLLLADAYDWWQEHRAGF